jgi:MFS family permease
MNAVTNIIISEMFEIHERGKYLGLIALASSIGLIAGVVLGAVFAEFSSWRWSVQTQPGDSAANDTAT